MCARSSSILIVVVFVDISSIKFVPTSIMEKRSLDPEITPLPLFLSLDFSTILLKMMVQQSRMESLYTLHCVEKQHQTPTTLYNSPLNSFGYWTLNKYYYYYYNYYNKR